MACTRGGNQLVVILVKWILYFHLYAWLQTQILNGTYESIFTYYLDRLTNPVPSVLNIMRLCLPGTVQDAGSHKIGGHRPTKRGCFLHYFLQKE